MNFLQNLPTFLLRSSYNPGCQDGVEIWTLLFILGKFGRFWVSFRGSPPLSLRKIVLAHKKVPSFLAKFIAIFGLTKNLIHQKILSLQENVSNTVNFKIQGVKTTMKLHFCKAVAIWESEKFKNLQEGLRKNRLSWLNNLTFKCDKYSTKR